jgi:hypothetical protein
MKTAGLAMRARYKAPAWKERNDGEACGAEVPRRLPDGTARPEHRNPSPRIHTQHCLTAPQTYPIFHSSAAMAPSSEPPSRSSTPRFTTQAATAEDLLRTQTVGLVNLSDFRKRRAEALEQKEREAQDKSLGRFTPSGAGTPDASDG